MLPTCNEVGDVWLVDKFSFKWFNSHRLREGDIVVLKNPLQFNDYLCKRIIHCGGKTFEYQGRKIYIP